MKWILKVLPIAFGLGLIAYEFTSSDRRFSIAQLSIAQDRTSEHCSVVRGSIYDGDTMRVNCNGEELKVRLCGIDAPEIQQAMGIEARDHLRSLVARGDGQIVVVPIEKDRYNRTVAELFVMLDGTEEEIHLNSQMTMDGYAWHYERYSMNCPNQAAIADAEAIAKGQSVGIWNTANPIAPWEWRRNEN